MTKRAAVPDDEQRVDAAPPARAKEYTPEPSVGGAFDEDGTCVQPGGIPEPDAHRMKQPER